MTRFGIFCFMALATGAASFGAHAQPAAGSPGAGTGTGTGTGTQDILAGMQVVVAADGSVAEVVPDAALPEPIRAGLVKRVAQWRYQVPMWQGQPVSTARRQGLRLQAVPTTRGGYALRVMGEAFVPDPDRRYRFDPPVYPHWLQRKGVAAVLVYAIHFGLDGKVVDAALLYPPAPLDRASKAYDAASRAAIATWAWRPFRVDGTAVECDTAVPVTFMLDGDTPPVAPDLKPYEAGMQQLCPLPRLETKIEGTLL